jgi:hypothetical protein
MDDILDSVNTVKEAEELSRGSDDIRANGGFKVKEWRSNEDISKNKATQEMEEIKYPRGTSEEKVLGVVWNNGDDVLKYKVVPDILKSQPVKITKQSILSQIARIYDPIGIASEQRLGSRNCGKRVSIGTMNSHLNLRNNGYHFSRK